MSDKLEGIQITAPITATKTKTERKSLRKGSAAAKAAPKASAAAPAVQVAAKAEKPAKTAQKPAAKPKFNARKMAKGKSIYVLDQHSRALLRPCRLHCVQTDSDRHEHRRGSDEPEPLPHA